MTDQYLEAVRIADTQANLTGYPQAIVDRNGALLVIRASQVLDTDVVLEMVRPC